MNLIILRLRYYVELFYTNVILNQNYIYYCVYNILTVSYEKSKIASFTFLRIKTIHAPSAWSRSQVKLICCMVFGSA